MDVQCDLNTCQIFIKENQKPMPNKISSKYRNKHSTLIVRYTRQDMVLVMHIPGPANLTCPQFQLGKQSWS